MPSSWHSKHPDGASYFLEYMPLLRESGGIEGFDPSFSVERFIPEGGPSGTISDGESAYVHALIEQVEKRGKIPVLTATRSLGRVAGLKAAAPGMHVVLYRSLMQQWCSYTEQAVRGNPYFLETIMEVFRLNGHDPVLSEIRDIFPVQAVSEKDLNLFCRFVLLHLYLYVMAFPAADLVLDINRASTDRGYRSELTDRFAAEDVRIDFSATADSVGCSMLDLSSRDRLLETLRVIGASICDRVESGEARAFGFRILSDLERELDAIEFHTKTMRSLYGRLAEQRDALSAEHEAARRDRDEASGQRDAAHAELAAVRAERDEARRQQGAAQVDLAAILAECDALKAELEAVRRERDEVGASRRTLQADLDAARARIQAGQRAEAAAKAESEAACRDRDRFRVERDAAKRASLSATAGTEVLRQEQRMLRIERDALLAARNDANLAREACQARYDEVVSWSAAYHQSTARSLSWRLTLPLRWLGIGRPVRPPKPDFFE